MSTESIPLETLERWINYRIEDAADIVGHPEHCYSSQDDWSDEQWMGYAEGTRRTLSAIAENAGISDGRLRFHRLNGAMGERWRRLYPHLNSLKSRALNTVLNAIRDKRIAMRDHYELLSYQEELAPWQAKVRKLERADKPGTDSYWRELEIVRTELDALHSLNSQCLSDKEWFAEYFRRKQIRDASARAIEVLEMEPL